MIRLLLIFALLASPAVAQDILTSICEPPDCFTGTAQTMTAQDNCSMSGPPNFACCAANGPECWECERRAALAYQEWLQCGAVTSVLLPEAQEPSRDSQLLDFYRELVAGKNREINALDLAIEERNKTISSQEATIKAWENRANGKMSKKDWIVLSLTVLAGFGTVVGR